MPGGEPRNIASVVYHNVAGMYDFGESLSLRVGLDNLTDKQPPSSLTNTNINFDQNTYNPTGRFWYMQMTWYNGL